MKRNIYVFTTLVSPVLLGVATTQAAIDSEIEREISLEGLLGLPYIDIATGYAVPLEKAPSVATVITAQDIEAMGAITLDEVLEAVPGLHGVHSNLVADTLFIIRGLYTNQNPQVLLLLNGNRISSDVYSSIFPSSGIINVRNIARIEVIRGPGSAIYGADAFSGVVNIVTKSARDLDGLHVGGRTGSLDTRNSWIQYGGEVGNGWSVALSLEYARQDADTTRTVSRDLQTTLDEQLNDLLGYPHASLAPGYIDRRYESATYNLHLESEHWRLGIDGWAQRDIGQGPGVGQALDHEGKADFDQNLITAEYHTDQWAEDLDFSTKLSYQVIDQQYHLNIFPPGNVSLIGADGNLFTPPFSPVYFPNGVIGDPGRKSTIPQAEVTFLYSGFTDHIWRWSAGAKEEKLETNEAKNFGPSVIDGSQPVVGGTLTDVTGTPYIYAPDRSRTVQYTSLQDTWGFAPDWTLTGGVRYDDYSDFGGTTNPRAALVWNTRDNLTTKLLYGRAFRAPSFAELYAQNNPISRGNSNLRPETIDTAELAFTYEPTHNLRTNLSIYNYRAKDMIDFVASGDGTRTAQNINRVKGKGFALEADWKVSDQWSVAANYSHDKPINEQTDEPQPLVPKEKVYLDARWAFAPDWRLAAQVYWVGDRERAAADTRAAVPDYSVTNLTLRRANIARHWEVAASVKNVFDTDGLEPSDGSIPGDYPISGRNAFVELSYQR